MRDFVIGSFSRVCKIPATAWDKFRYVPRQVMAIGNMNGGSNYA